MNDVVMFFPPFVVIVAITAFATERMIIHQCHRCFSLSLSSSWSCRCRVDVVIIIVVVVVVVVKVYHVVIMIVGTPGMNQCFYMGGRGRIIIFIIKRRIFQRSSCCEQWHNLFIKRSSDAKIRYFFRNFETNFQTLIDHFIIIIHI